ncbi:bifunctional DNA primase/polymerase [Streptomyces sp. NPDC006879]|uniref:bifunctional DNA primase/polymerase n=1 Tax=Streptomyces sp. NPDC006879 TaxID=3364767 RepID=UPI0036C2E031
MAIRPRHIHSLALAHALSAAEHGLSVIPLTRTKHPAIPSPHHPSAPTCRGACGRPGHGVHDATNDPRAVRALFAAAPWATGYGVACGLAPYHLIGLDLDVRPDGSDSAAPHSRSALRHLALRHLFTLPETVSVHTPSGGLHLWFAGTAEAVVANSASRLAPGIDVRGAGGYLVGPGSLGTRGTYRLTPESTGLPPAPCPEALLQLLAPAAPKPRTSAGHRGSAGRALVQFVLAAHPGQRNTRLFWAACRAYESGLGEVLATPLARAAARTGLSEREAGRTIASAARRYRAQATRP